MRAANQLQGPEVETRNVFSGAPPGIWGPGRSRIQLHMLRQQQNKSCDGHGGSQVGCGWKERPRPSERSECSKKRPMASAQKARTPGEGATGRGLTTEKL